MLVTFEKSAAGFGFHGFELGQGLAEGFPHLEYFIKPGCIDNAQWPAFEVAQNHSSSALVHLLMDGNQFAEATGSNKADKRETEYELAATLGDEISDFGLDFFAVLSTVEFSRQMDYGDIALILGSDLHGTLLKLMGCGSEIVFAKKTGRVSVSTWIFFALPSTFVRKNY